MKSSEPTTAPPPAATGSLPVFARERRMKRVAAGFFAALLLTGLWLVGDYGLSWDESE